MTYTDIPVNMLLKAYKEGPDRLTRLVEGLSEQELKQRVIDGKWSIFEIVLHVADSELVGTVRLKQCYSQSDTCFPFYNQDIWADTFSYQKQPLDQMMLALDLFENLRKTGMTIYDSCSDKDWLKTGIHPESGEITLRNILELYSDHSERHIELLDRVERFLTNEALILDLNDAIQRAELDDQVIREIT